MELVTDEQLSDYVWRGVRAIGAGAVSLLLAVLNFPLFLLWLASLIVALVPGLVAGLTRTATP